MSRNRRNRKRQGKQGAARSGRPEKRAGAPAKRPLSRAKIRRRLHLGAGALFVLALVGGLWWLSSVREQEFMALADRGREALSAQVISERSDGRQHVSGSQNYDHRFPTSGPHSRTWVDPGVYTERQRKEQLVHAIEHGNIVIYHDEPGEAVMNRLHRWAALYDGQWSGIVVTPAPGLGESVVLTAWTKRLRLDEFQPDVAAAFIDTYRGRGPEKPVR